MPKIKKALITCAGFGTRFLPISKTIQKEMLPILNRPIVDYLVEDCIKAGINEIIFVVSTHNYQVLHFYRENKRLYEYLSKMNKLVLYEQIAHLHTQAKFHFVKQDNSVIYGTATPVQLAQKYLQDEEAFLVLMGDDFLYNSDRSSEVARMIKLYETSQAKALVTCIEKPTEELHRYGVAQIYHKNNLTYLKNLIEKPKPGTAPSNLSNISKYIFTPQVFEAISQQAPNTASGELYITDTITQIAKQSPVVVHVSKGEYLDGGNLLGWLKANLVMAKSKPKLYKQLSEFVKKEWLDK